MGAEAEKYKAEDGVQEKVEARNQLENFCHVKNMAEEQLGEMSADNIAAIEKASKDGLSSLTRTRTRRRPRSMRR